VKGIFTSAMANVLDSTAGTTASFEIKRSMILSLFGMFFLSCIGRFASNRPILT
jgi:hypothetical protein